LDSEAIFKTFTSIKFLSMKTSIHLRIAISISIAFTLSCNQSATNIETKSLDGIWKSLGYGRIVKIEEEEFVMAEVTNISCIPLMDGYVSDFSDKLKIQNDTLILEDGINNYLFTRIDNAPEICKNDSQKYADAKANAHDPEYNFEVLWETFKDHYAYFELRNVDPQKMYNTYRPKVNANTSDPELFLILNEMLESFNDGHIGIEATEEIEAAAEKLYMANQTTASSKDSATENPKESLRNYQVASMLGERYIPNGSSIKNGNLRWGIIDDNIAYLQINQMMGMADYGISDTLSWRDYWMAYFEKLESAKDDNEDELQGINESLDIIMKDVAQTDALIIDLRFNGGGKDEVAMAVLERINDRDRMVFTKKGKMGNGFTPTNKVIQAGSKNHYSKPVYLLIGPESASATEIMALSSLSLPTVTRVGSKTEGVFSDVLDRMLPNGWEFGLSSEVYMDLKGNNFEGIGISPDIEIGYDRDTQKFLQKVVDGIRADGDDAIEKALALISLVE